MSTELTNLITSLPSIMIFILVIIYIFKKPISYRIKTFKLVKKQKNNESLSKLVNHDIFNVIEQVRYDIKRVIFHTHGTIDKNKTRIFCDFMNFKLDSVTNNFIDFLSKVDKQTDKDELKKELLDMLSDTVEEYTEHTRIHFLNKGLSVEDCDYIILLFEKWRYDTIKSLVSRINNIFASDFHSNNFERLLASFEVASMAIELIPKDGVNSFEEINGRFKEIIY